MIKWSIDWLIGKLIWHHLKWYFLSCLLFRFGLTYSHKCSVLWTVDVRNAGDGTLEISISGPSGQNVSNNVTAQGPGLFVVNYVPVESGQHRANVTFNKENIRGWSVSWCTLNWRRRRNCINNIRLSVKATTHQRWLPSKMATPRKEQKDIAKQICKQ